MPFDADRDRTSVPRAPRAASTPWRAAAGHSRWALGVVVASLAASSPLGASMPGTPGQAHAPARIEQFDTGHEIPPAERAAVFEDYVLVFRAAFARGDFAGAAALAARATRLYPAVRRP